MLDHFSRSELACPTTDELRLATGFGEALERLRVELDAPIYLSSACRSPTHNAKVGGHPRSLHLVVNSHWGTGGCCAIDANAARLSALEAGQVRAKRLAEITSHLDTLDDDELDRRLRHYRRTSSRVRMD